MLHDGLLPLFAALGDDHLVDGDLSADGLGGHLTQAERGIEECVVLEGLPVDVKDEFPQFLVEIDSGLDTAILFVNKGDRKN